MHTNVHVKGGEVGLSMQLVWIDWPYLMIGGVYNYAL